MHRRTRFEKVSSALSVGDTTGVGGPSEKARQRGKTRSRVVRIRRDEREAKSPAKLTAITPDGWSKPYRSFRKGSAKRAAGTEPPVNCEGALCERHIAVRTNKAILTTSCTM